MTPDGQKLDFVRQLQKIKTHQVQERFKEIEATLPDEKHLDGQPREREKQNKRRTRTQGREEKARFTGERKRATIDRQAIQDKAIQEQTARHAGETFADITARPEPEIAQKPEQTIYAEKLQEFKTNQAEKEKTKEEKAYQAGQNFKDVTRAETDDEREIREAFESLRDNDFGLEHEL